MQSKFIYQEQSVEKILKSISSERLSTYMKQVNNDHINALKLYICNIKLSESFYTPLQGLEITLRNAVHNKLSKHFGTDWLTSGKFPFEYEQKIKIDEITNKLRNNCTIPKTIAELNLGFWVGLFGRKYEEHWRHCLRQTFKVNNGTLRRKDLYQDLNDIRQLRNRIAHHEPIFHKDLVGYYESIIKIIFLLCPETSLWIADNSNFLEVYNSYVRNE